MPGFCAGSQRLDLAMRSLTTCLLFGTVAAAIGGVKGADELRCTTDDFLAPCMREAPRMPARSVAWDLDETAPHVSVFPSAASRNNSAVTVPLGAMPLCLAYNVPSATSRLGVDRTEMARLLGVDVAGAGRAGVTLRDYAGTAVVADASALKLVGPPPGSAVTAARFRSALASLVSGGEAVQPPTLPAPPAPDVAVSSEAEVAARVATTPMSFGLVPLPLATRQRVPCAALRFVHEFDARVEWKFLPPTMPMSAAGRISVSDDTVGVASVHDTYPLLAPVFATLPAAGSPACEAADRGMTTKFLGALGSEALHDHLARWGVLLRHTTSMAKAAEIFVKHGCGAPVASAAGGSSAVFPLMADLAMRSVDTGLWMSYAPEGSGFGEREVNRGALRWGASDAAYADKALAASPTFRNVPLTAFAVALPYNLGQDLRDLTIPLCLVHDLFTGAVTRWNDSRLQAANPFAVLPDLPVVPVVRLDKSGTSHIFTSGLERLGGLCGAASDVPVTKQWPVSAHNVTGLVQAVKGSRGMISAVQDTMGTIGYVGLSSSVSAGLPAARVIHPEGVTVAPDPAGVSRAVVGASVDDHTRITMGVVSGGYPFTGVTYAMFDTELTGNCAAAGGALRWLRDAIGGQAERAVHLELNYVPLPPALAARAVRVINTVKCDGELLLVKPPPPPPGPLVWPYALAGVIVVLAVLAAPVVLAINRWRAARRLRYCPTDPSKPFAAFFVTVTNEALLREELPPADLSRLLQRLDREVSRAADRHGCYVARRLEAHFLLVARGSESVLRCAVDIVNAINGCDALVADATRLVNAASRAFTVSAAPAGSTSPSNRASARSPQPADDGTSPSVSSHSTSTQAASIASPPAASLRSRARFAGRKLRIRAVAGVAFGFGRIMPPSDETAGFGYAGEPVDAAAAAADATAQQGRRLVGCGPGVYDSVHEAADDEDHDGREVDGEFVPATDDDGHAHGPLHHYFVSRSAVCGSEAEHHLDFSDSQKYLTGGKGTAGAVAAALQQRECGITTRRVAAVVIRMPYISALPPDSALQAVRQIAAHATATAEADRGRVHEVSNAGVSLLFNATEPVVLPLARALGVARKLTAEFENLFGARCFAGVGYAVSTVGLIDGTSVGGGFALERARLLAKAAVKVNSLRGGASHPDAFPTVVEDVSSARAAAATACLPVVNADDDNIALKTAVQPATVMFAGNNAPDIETAFRFEAVDIGVWPDDALPSSSRRTPFALMALRESKLQADDEDADDEWMYLMQPNHDDMLDGLAMTVEPQLSLQGSLHASGKTNSPQSRDGPAEYLYANGAARAILSEAPGARALVSLAPALRPACDALERHNDDIHAAAMERMSVLCPLFAPASTPIIQAFMHAA